MCVCVCVCVCVNDINILATVTGSSATKINVYNQMTSVRLERL